MADDTFTPEETGPVVLWPTSAIEVAMAERDRLLGIIDRAAGAIDGCDLTTWHRVCEILEEVGQPEPAAIIFRFYRAISKARGILAEAEPEDLESRAPSGESPSGPETGQPARPSEENPPRTRGSSGGRSTLPGPGRDG